MRLYPDTPDDRGRAVARDALTLLTLFVLGLARAEGPRRRGRARRARHRRAPERRGRSRAGSSGRRGRRGVPVVGGEVGDALRDAGEGTGGEVADRPAATARSACTTWPTCSASSSSRSRRSILLVTTLPGRIRQVRELNATERLLDTSLGGAPPPGRDESGLLPARQPTWPATPGTRSATWRKAATTR